jgi:hypothetical protein
MELTMSSPTLDAPTMTRLALIRLLYQQGVEQAAQPEPLSLFSLLAFHDSVELFLVLAADHLGAQMPKGDPGFMDYWHILRPTEAFPAGVSLTGKGRMDRLNRNRNALKHAGALPSRSAVDDALSSAASFFEENTAAAFGVAFDAIDMADVVPQEGIRKLVKAAAAEEGAGRRQEAMARLAVAFAKLLYPYTRSPSSRHGFGSRMPRTTSVNGVGDALQSLAHEMRSRQAGNIRIVAQRVDRNISQLNVTVSAMQDGMRVLSLGIDYARYTLFEQLTPRIARDDEEKPVLTVAADYAPTREEYDFCVQFLIGVALRVAEVDASAVKPSWVSARAAGTHVGTELLTLQL